MNEQVRNSSSHLQYTTNIIGTLVSGIFLFLIAAINVVILAGIVRVFRGMRTGQYDAVSASGDASAPRANIP